jgi:hypothetical protein
MSGFLFHNSWAVPTFEDADISEFEGFGIEENYGLGSLTVAVCRRALPPNHRTLYGHCRLQTEMHVQGPE